MVFIPLPEAVSLGAVSFEKTWWEVDASTLEGLGGIKILMQISQDITEASGEGTMRQTFCL